MFKKLSLCSHPPDKLVVQKVHKESNLGLLYFDLKIPFYGCEEGDTCITLLRCLNCGEILTLYNADIKGFNSHKNIIKYDEVAFKETSFLRTQVCSNSEIKPEDSTLIVNYLWNEKRMKRESRNGAFIIFYRFLIVFLSVILVYVIDHKF